MDETRRIKKMLKNRQPPRKEVLRNKDLLSTGSTLLNLALSGKARGGLYAGKYYFIVGDSNSGKTWTSMTCFAEAAINERFARHRLIHDNAEDGVLMDVERYFGRAVQERIEPPAGTRTNPVYSSTTEEFYYHIDDAFDKGEPFIYVLDSMDSLEAEADRKKFKERKIAKSKDKEITGSYGTDKAKLNSTGMRSVIARLKKSDSILIVISQTRDNIGFGFNEKTRSGGKALRFYAHCEFWTSVVKTLKKKVNDKDRKLGIVCRAKVEKNRQTGRNIEVDFPIYWSVGIDDVGSCVDYLIAEKHWNVVKGRVKADELSLLLSKEELIQTIQTQGMETQLKAIVSQVWEEIKVACSPIRKNRYTQ
jgi:RecA/RadA recombinase